MTLAGWLSSLRDLGVRLWLDGDRLRCSAPSGVVTPELRAELTRRKAEIVEFLRSADAVATERGVVLLQPGGDRAPVFAVAGHNGDIFCYRTFAKEVGDRPFFALEPPGLDGRDRPLDRVEDLAAYFARQIRAVHAHGSCVIAGYCAGGTVAFELARQLLSRGTSIGCVAMFAAPYPSAFRYQRLRRLMQHARRVAGIPTIQARWRYVSERGRRLGAVAAAPSREMPGEAVIRGRRHVERATLAAVRRYRPRLLPGRMAMFLPNAAWAASEFEPRQWRKLVVDYEEFSSPDACSMDVMLRGPDTPALAAAFRRACDANADPALPLPAFAKRSFAGPLLRPSNDI